MNRRRFLARLYRGAVHNVSFNDLIYLIVGFGFILVRVNGSHHYFEHPDIPDKVNVQSDRGEAKPYQIRQFLKVVELHGLRLEGEE